MSSVIQIGSGVTALWGRKWPFPITLASGLYNGLYYRTSRDMVFSADGCVLIKVLRQEKGHGAKNSSQIFPPSQIWGKLQERVYRSRIHRCSSIKRSGSGVHVFQLALEHTDGILNTHFSYV